MTAQVLQKPQILGIKGSTIRVAHPDVSKYPSTQLAAQVAAAGTTLTVNDNQYPRFDDNDWLLIGEIGDETTETCDINNGSMSKGTSITVTNNLDFAHELTAPVTKIFERGIKIYGAATDGGSGTLIASINAITASGKKLADAVMIQWNRPVYSEYTLINTDTAYAYYYATFTDGTTESSASDYIPAAGWDNARVIKLIEHALDETDTQLDNRQITLDMCVNWADECQKHITQYKYQDPVTGRLQHVDWDFEVFEDTSLTVSEGETEYTLSGMTVDLKYQDSDRSIISVRVGVQQQFKKITIKEYDRLMANKPKTYVATQASAGDTSLVVDSTYEFASSGTLYIGDEELTYTGTSGGNTFTGIPASGTGSIAATISVDEPVWQNLSLGLPDRYCIFAGKIYFTQGYNSDYANQSIKIRGYKALTALSEASDQTEVSFYNVFHLFIQSRIERRKGNEDKAAYYMQEFEKQVLNNALANDVPTLDHQTYYNFVYDDNLGMSCDDVSCDCGGSCNCY